MGNNQWNLKIVIRLSSLILVLNWVSLSSAEKSPDSVPLMLPRSVQTRVDLVNNGEPCALIVVPQRGAFTRAGREVQEIVRITTGAAIPLRAPGDVTGERGLLLTEEAKKKTLILVGNLSTNSALFEPYLRRLLVADERQFGPGEFLVMTCPNPWGTGAGLILIDASGADGLKKALEAFAKAVADQGKPGRLALARMVMPGSDSLQSVVGSWKRLARPRNEDWLKGFKKSKKMHLGYHVGRMLFQFTLITDLGYLTDEEVNDIENEVLENILMFPEKVWWYRSGGGVTGDRHTMFKNPRLYLAVEHLLKVGKPNDVARRQLEQIARGPVEYMHYVATQAYHSDAEGEFEAGHAWQSAIWFALLRGDWKYFESGSAQDAALYGLHQTDNLGGLAGHIQYGGVGDMNTPSTVRNAMRAAAWWHKDGRFRWLLDHMPFSKEYPYGFPLNLPIDRVVAEKPQEWLGVQWLPVSPHSYDNSVKDAGWQQPNIPRSRTVNLLTFREGYGYNDQYLCLDGLQSHSHPLGLNSVLRYVDRGKLFLVAHTGKEGNYYKSGVVVSRGVQTAPEPWGVELVAAADLPGLGLTATRFANANGCDWIRCIFWKRGEYFLFLDNMTALKPGQFNLTATWRTAAPARLTDEGWNQKQTEVMFWLKPSFSLDQIAGQAPGEEYRNEVVPYLLRQTIQFSAEQEGMQESFQNIIYATDPSDEQSFVARRICPTACLVQGTRTCGDKTTAELALVGLGKNVEKDLSIETDAMLFYISPERIGFANGTFLRCKGTLLAEIKNRGHVETEVSDAHRRILSDYLTALWESADTESKRITEIAEPDRLLTKWTFDDFRDHACTVVPFETEKSPDGKSHTYHFDGLVDLAEVSVGEPANISFENIMFEFSRDRFRQDIRTSTSPPERSFRILGPHGKSDFATQNLLTIPGRQCCSARIKLTEWKENRSGSVPSISFAEFHTTQREPATISRLITSDLDGDGRREAVILTKDNQLVVLDHDGRRMWEHMFKHNLMTLEALDVDQDGAKEILACDAASDFYCFTPNGSLEKKLRLSTSDDIYEDYFRSNRGYSMGLWRTAPNDAPALILGTYQSIAWITEQDEIVCWPSGEPAFQSGYVWRGLVYWERALPEGIDLNSDGVEDQAFMSRGWTAKPTMMLFDGATREALAEYEIPNGRTIGLELVRLAGGRKAILGMNEFHLGLYSTEGGQELWRVRFDTPAAAYAVVPTDTQPLICVAKRDGLLMTFDFQGKVISRRLLSPELTDVAPIRIDSLACVLVASGQGITVLTTMLNPIGHRRGAYAKLASLNDTTVLAAGYEGKVVALAPGRKRGHSTFLLSSHPHRQIATRFGLQNALNPRGRPSKKVEK